MIRLSKRIGITVLILSIIIGVSACDTNVSLSQDEISAIAGAAASTQSEVQDSEYVMPEEPSGPASYLPKNPDGSVSYNGKKYKRNKAVKAILCLGIDRHDDMKSVDSVEKVGRSDGIFLIAQDTARNKIKLLVIPRDSMVEVDMVEDDGTHWSSFDHLNVAFTNGDGRHVSCRASAKAVSDLLCGLDIDHYMAMDLSMLSYVNDEVGGVTVTIPNDQLVKTNPEWTEGSKIKLLGDDAERFIRYRDTNVEGSPFYRVQQHKAYIAGFVDAVKEKSKSDSSLISRISDNLTDYMVTDMNKGEYEKIALDGLQSRFDSEADMVSLPGHGELVEETEGYYDQWYVDYIQTIPILLDFFYREVG